MKNFTLKDFISYNNPCFSCGNKINFNIISVPISDELTRIVLRPTVKLDSITVDLKINYHESLQLQIMMPSNIFFVSDKKFFTDYINNNKLYLNSSCSNCHTILETYSLDFNFDKGFLKPVKMCKENLIVIDGIHRYCIYTSHLNIKSTIVIYHLNLNISPVYIKSPILSLSKFRDRSHLIHKMKTYLTFS